MQAVKESMLPGQTEMKSKAWGNLKHMRQPLKTSSRFKKVKKGGPNPLSVKQASGHKKKRPGPRLRNALKAAAQAEAMSEKASG